MREQLERVHFQIPYGALNKVLSLQKRMVGKKGLIKFYNRLEQYDENSLLEQWKNYKCIARVVQINYYWNSRINGVITIRTTKKERKTTSFQ